MKYKELIDLKKKLMLLIDQTDPFSNASFTSDSILSSKKNKEILIRTTELIDLYIEKNLRYKRAFYVEQVSLKDIPLSEFPISISEFTHVLNKYKSEESRKLRATDLTEWLASLGYLKEEYDENNNIKRILGEKSLELQLKSEKRKNINTNTDYNVILYGSIAQSFVIKNLEELTAFLTKAKYDRVLKK